MQYDCHHAKYIKYMDKTWKDILQIINSDCVYVLGLNYVLPTFLNFADFLLMT